MNFPRWASPNHPIARRELNLWHKAGRKWRWLATPMLLIPVCCVGACGLTMFPQAIAENSAAAWLFTIALPFIVGLWSLHALATWALSLFLTIGAATLIARERETQNWALLRISTLGAGEIIGAKVSALLHWLRWPILGVFLLRLAVTLLSFGGVGLFIYFIQTLDPSAALPPDLMLNLNISLVALGLISTLFFLVELLISVFYNCAVGLTASAFMRTSASAVGVAFASHLGLGIFVFAPVQQAITFGLGIVSAYLMPQLIDSTVGPLFLPLAAGVVSYLVNILLEVGIVAGCIFLSLDQAKRLTE